jgi:hypothetical protein
MEDIRVVRDSRDTEINRLRAENARLQGERLALIDELAQEREQNRILRSTSFRAA